MEKKIYVEPSVKKVEFEFNERIAASGCDLHMLDCEPLYTS